MLLRLVATVAGTLGAYALYEILKLIYQDLRPPLRHLPGPKSTHWFYGNLRDIQRADNSVLHEQWVQKYGPVLKYKAFLGLTRLYTHDAKALNHFLVNSYIYQRPEPTRYTLTRVLGPGLLITEEDVHKRQRKIMNPAFGAPQVRELTGIFVEKSIQASLRDIWVAQAEHEGGVARVEIGSWLTKATLDIIGLAGFHHKFDSLSAEDTANPNELAKAFSTMLKAGTKMSYFRILQLRFPVFRRIPTELDKLMEISRATTMRIARQLLQESKKEAAESGTFDNGGYRRDLLSLLVRANTAKDIPAHQQLSDDDFLAQVPTFLVAGHETTSSATTWALFALTQNTAAQARLRKELLGLSTDNPTMDELNALPFLECVVRETLRLYAPVPTTIRVATRDDIVPLSAPFTDLNGKIHETLKITKGQTVLIPILAMNRDQNIWGSDAMEFIPERWETPISNSVPGVWGNMLTFLGGPRSCIGFRFSLVETKALLFTLIRAFEFELAVPAHDIRSKTSIVQRPVLRSDPEAGPQLPLLVKPYVRQ
ncbi:cytochrome P450 [Mycena rebaudengoi]|nr:cytochrome P450 [Mycena rebaudengoi]